MSASRSASTPSGFARWWPALPLLSGALSAGCGAAAVGAGLVSLSAPGSDPCVQQLTSIVHLDDPTALGFSAIDVLTRLTGPRSVPMEWGEPQANDEYLFEYGPERGSSELEIDVRAGDGRALLRQYVPRFGAPEDTSCEPDVLEIPVEVTLRSNGQALDERFDTRLEASVPYRARIRQILTPRTLHGGLSFFGVQSLDPERSFWVGPIALDALLWEGGSKGSLSVQLGGGYTRVVEEFRPFPAPATQPPPLATWPATRGAGAAEATAPECRGDASYLPSDAKVLGFSARDVLARLGSQAPRAVTWADGSIVPVLLEPEAPEAELCQRFDDALRFDAVLRAHNADGSLDVRVPVQVEADGEDGNIGAISIESSEPETPQPIVRTALRRPSVRFEGYRALLVALDWTSSDGSDSGSLALRGVDSRTPDAEGHYPSSVLGNGSW